MKAPPKRKGNVSKLRVTFSRERPSMKAPPKRKGNAGLHGGEINVTHALNESPSEKEGK